MVFQLEEMKRSRVERLVTFNLQTETIPTRGASLTSNRDLKSCLCPVWNQKFCSLNLTKLWLKTEVTEVQISDRTRDFIVGDESLCPVRIQSSNMFCCGQSLYYIIWLLKAFRQKPSNMPAPAAQIDKIYERSHSSQTHCNVLRSSGWNNKFKGRPVSVSGFFWRVLFCLVGSAFDLKLNNNCGYECKVLTVSFNLRLFTSGSYYYIQSILEDKEEKPK